MGSKKLWRSVALSLIISIPAGGFFFGLFHPGDPDPNPIGRFLYACILAVMTPLHAGFPPHEGAGVGRTFNVWPHIGIVWLLILGWIVFREWRSAKKSG